MRLSIVCSLQIYFIGLLNVKILGRSVRASLGSTAEPSDELMVLNNDPVDYLFKFGYMGNPRQGRSEPTADEIEVGLRKFQKFMRIPETGVIDARSVEIMNTLRCNVPDILYDGSIYRQGRYVLSGRQWPVNNLEWNVNVVESSTFSRTQLEVLVSRAANEWAYPTLLNFNEGSAASAHIRVGFYQRGTDGEHGDGAPFQPSDLGHAFYPGTFPIDGDAHMNMNQRFYISYLFYDAFGSDLYFTMVHELGHTLGLDHSGESASIMYPTLPRGRSYGGLHADDIAAIQSLYEVNPVYSGTSLSFPSLHLVLIGLLTSIISIKS